MCFAQGGWLFTAHDGGCGCRIELVVEVRVLRRRKQTDVDMGVSIKSERQVLLVVLYLDLTRHLQQRPRKAWRRGRGDMRQWSSFLDSNQGLASAHRRWTVA